MRGGCNNNHTTHTVQYEEQERMKFDFVGGFVDVPADAFADAIIDYFDVRDAYGVCTYS